MISTLLPPGSGSVLSGVGHHFPGRSIPNSDLTPALGIDDDWVIRHTGVRTRHWPQPEESMIDMARSASLQALAAAGFEPSDVDVIIGSSATARHGINPTTNGNRYADVALPLQRALGADHAACMDVSGMACASFLMSSLTARGLMATTPTENVLVVCVENPLPILSEHHRNRTLFGAGAAAAVWRRSEVDHIHAAVVNANAVHYDAFNIDDDHKIMMRGRVVSSFASDALVSATKTALEQSGMSISGIDWIIPHQGNINIIDDLAAQLSLPREKILTNIDRRGNVSSVSAPGCLSENVYSGVINPGDTILTAMIGRGFTWGAMVFDYGEEVA